MPGLTPLRWGVDQDAAAFRDFVRRYLSANNRQASPVFLFGESYGAPRTAVLANLLESAGVRVAGVMLQSAIMDYNANCGVFDPGKVSCEGYIPSYAAVSAYHQNGSLPTDFSSVLQRARQFAAGSYRGEVSAFIAGGTAPGEATLAQLATYTGLPAQTWRQDFSMAPGPYRARLMPGQMIGRYDARVKAPSGSALTANGDPSLTLVNSAFVNTIRNYLESELRYTASTPYLSFNSILDGWSFTHDGKALPDTIPDLAAALTLNPALKVIGRASVSLPSISTRSTPSAAALSRLTICARTWRARKPNGARTGHATIPQQIHSSAPGDLRNATEN